MASKDKQRSSEPVPQTRCNTNPYLKQNVTLVEKQLKDLNDELQQADLKDWPGIFNDWCCKVIATSYPDIGSKAYAVPYHFQGKLLLAPYIHDTQRCLDAAPSQEKPNEDSAKEKVNIACPGKVEETKQAFATEKTKKASTRVKPGKQIESSKASAKEQLTVACTRKVEEYKALSATGKPKKASTKAKPGKQTTPKEQAETEPRKKRLSLEDSRDTFVICVTPGTEFKGERAHRIVGRAFRIQNAEFERNKQKTMFIMSQLNYDNLLPWLRQGCTDKIDSYLSSKDYPHVFGNPNSYIDIVEIEQQLGDKRGELDFMILHQEKGIVLVQVKHISSTYITENAGSSSTETNAIPPEKIQQKVSDASKQLEKDTALLHMMMKRSRNWHQDGFTKVTRVVAVPRLSREELTTFDLWGQVESDMIFLCKDDMFEESAESIDNSELETNIENFRRWWINYLPNRKVSLEFMQEIIGKYIGPLSAVLEPKQGNQKERLLTFQHCVQHTQLALACNLLTRTQRNILEEKTKEQRRVYISGPPGSGKTVLLILKAHNFLKESEGHRVIIVNMYRGAKGRAIGKHTFTTLSKHKNRIHHLEVNVGTQSFVAEVMKELEQADLSEKSEGACSKSKEVDPKSLLKNVLFIVDEIYVESFWQGILDAFSGELAESEVWCAGLFSKNPKGFEEHELDFVLRCPPAVQNLLYHVDWDEERKKKYRRDTEWIEVSTNGPIPLCVRHEHHVNCASTPVIDCAQCAEELAQVLKNEHFVKTTASDKDPKERAVSEPLPSTYIRDASAVTPPTSDLKVVILVNMPRHKYSKSGNYIETTEEAYTSYMAQVRSSTFIKMLKAKGINVDVKAVLGCKDMDPGEGDDVMATWLYNFQGLEAGVVIFLPGDVSPDQQHSITAREIPTPGLTTAASSTSRRPSPAVSESCGLSASTSTQQESPDQGVTETETNSGPSVDSSRETMSSAQHTHPATHATALNTKCTSNVSSEATESQSSPPKSKSEAEAETLAVSVSKADISNNPMSRPSGKGEVHSVIDPTQPVPSTAGIESQGEDQVRLRPHPGETRAGRREGIVFSRTLESQGNEGEDQLRSHPGETRAPGGEGLESATASKESATASRGSATASKGSEDTVGVQLRFHPKEIGAVGGGRDATLLPKGTDNMVYSLTQMQWMTHDIQRYSDWDKTNILIAGSRSLSLLILMVP